MPHELGLSPNPLAQCEPIIAPEPSTSSLGFCVEWSWDYELEDRKKEAKADAAIHNFQPFQVDRKVLKDVVKEHFGCEVGRLKFLSSGTCAATLAFNCESFIERVTYSGTFHKVLVKLIPLVIYPSQRYPCLRHISSPSVTASNSSPE
jgi:hypothetical protein